MRKFDINILHTCPPHLSNVAILPWEIQKKVIFSSIIHNNNKYIASYKLVIAISCNKYQPSQMDPRGLTKVLHVSRCVTVIN